MTAERTVAETGSLSVSVFLTRIAGELSDLSHQAQSLETTLGQIGTQSAPTVVSGARDIQELDRMTQTLECLSECVTWAASQASLQAPVELDDLIKEAKMHSVLQRLKTGQRYTDPSGETEEPELF